VGFGEGVLVPFSCYSKRFKERIVACSFLVANSPFFRRRRRRRLKSPMETERRERGRIAAGEASGASGV
jgi:hypothetical protein